MKYFIIAGEASGDLHSSNLMRALKAKDSKAEFFCYGGEKMKSAGGHILRHYNEMAFMGFLSVLLNIHKIIDNFKYFYRALKTLDPDVVILVDYPGFNLRIAKYVKKNTKIPVVYYIAPKLWAWKSYRIKDIKKYVDLLITIFPFETEFFAKFNYPVSYAGNPSVDSVSNGLKNIPGKESFLRKNKLSTKPIIALLPGSRVQEIKSCLPRMLDAASKFSEYQLVVAGTDSVSKQYYLTITKGRNVKVLNDQTYALLKYAEVAIVNSGTATLETALIGTPQVVVYHVMLGKFAMWMKDLFIKTKFVSLVNIIAQKEIVKELLGPDFNVKSLAMELNEIITDDDYRNTIISEYNHLKLILGDEGCSVKAADFIQTVLAEKTSKRDTVEF